MKHKRIWVFLTAILIGVAAFLASSKWPDLNAIFGGVGASIIASLIFWILTDVLQDNSEREYLASIIYRQENLELLRSGNLDGLVDIRQRDKDADRFWIDFADYADTKLTLSGRTLTRWLGDENQKKALTYALNRIAKKSARVDLYDEPIRLIIYSDDGLINEAGRIGSETLDSLIIEKNQIQKYLYEIWNKLSIPEKANLVVYEVNQLPYLYCNNGKHCVTGTYFDNRSDKMNLQLVFRCGGNSVEREYTEDFNAMIRKARRLVDLTGWKA